VTTPAAFLDASKAVCSKPWSEVEEKFPLDGQEKDTNVKWCFSSSYATELLLRGLGLPEDKHITIQKFVENSEIEWALGAAYKEVSDFLKRTNLRSP
jgi:Golgi nucleoside diphosphatase